MIAEQFDAFLFDLDGAVYVGEEPTPGAAETIDRLRDRGATIRFLTNNPRATREEIVERLNGMGVAVADPEVVTAGWAAARYVARQGAETVAVVGTDGLAAELRAAGLELVESDPDAVVVGAANDTDYGDIGRAARLIRAGAPFVATNPDAYFPTPEGPAPGTGAIVRAVEVASETRPTVVGKPDPRIFELALEGVETDAVVVGDNPETDVLGAHRAGLSAVLVGDRTPPGAAASDFRRPDAAIEDLRGLFDPEVSLPRWTSPGFDWPDAVVPAAAALVRDGEGRVLLVPDEDGWTLPSAEVERAETVAEAARRAIRGAGLEATVVGLVGVYSDPAEQVTTRGDGALVQRVTTCLACEVEENEAAEGTRFFDLASLPADLDPVAETILDDAMSSDGPVVH